MTTLSARAWRLTVDAAAMESELEQLRAFKASHYPGGAAYEEVVKVCDEAKSLHTRLSAAHEALRLVLLYHSGSPWDEAKSHKWERATGRSEATTRALCDHIRSVLFDAAKALPPEGDK